MFLTRKFRKVLVVLWAISILFLSFYPMNKLAVEPRLPYFDKLVHFVLYFVLSFLVMSSLKSTKNNWVLFHVLWSVFAYGLMIEIGQGIFTYYRSTSIFDLIANFLGCIGAIGIYRTFFCLGKGRISPKD